MSASQNSASQTKQFIGRLQHSTSRITTKQTVIYDQGGDDFRTVAVSSMGKQVAAYKHTGTSARITIGKAPRFGNSDSIGPGPNMAGVSSLKKQLVSYKASAPTSHFGTSTRDDALKQYAIYTTKR